jgi:hypothetical protein
MSQEIASIDTSPIDALLQIRTKQEQLQQLVERAESSRSKVSEAVYRRVSADYEARKRALEAEAKPLRKKARQEHTKLAPIHERLRRQVEEARLDKEELEFRHSVGELGDEDFSQRNRAAEELLATRQQAFTEADELSQRLAGVMGAEEAEPEPAAKPAARSAAGRKVATESRFDDNDTTATLAQVEEDDAGATVMTTAPPPGETAPGDSEATAWIPADQVPTAEQNVPAEGTMVMRFARLVAEGSSGEEYQLGLRTTVGRTPDNDITIANGLVSRHHAVITYSNNGYVVADLNSGNGTFVNDQRIEQHTLAESDHLKIGPTVFVFHAAEE